MVGKLSIPPSEGATAWVYGESHAPFPKKVVQGLQGTIQNLLDSPCGDRVVVVKDAEGFVWSFDARFVDCGLAFCDGYRWFGENDRSVQAWLDRIGLPRLYPKSYRVRYTGEEPPAHLRRLRQMLQRQGRSCSILDAQHVFNAMMECAEANAL